MSAITNFSNLVNIVDYCIWNLIWRHFNVSPSHVVTRQQPVQEHWLWPGRLLQATPPWGQWVNLIFRWKRVTLNGRSPEHSYGPGRWHSGGDDYQKSFSRMVTFFAIRIGNKLQWMIQRNRVLVKTPGRHRVCNCDLPRILLSVVPIKILTVFATSWRVDMSQALAHCICSETVQL